MLPDRRFLLPGGPGPRPRRSEIRRPGSNRIHGPRGLVARLALATQPPDQRWDRLVQGMALGDRDALASLYDLSLIHI